MHAKKNLKIALAVGLFVFVAMRARADETLLACWPLTNGTENIVAGGSAGVLYGNAVFRDGALELDGSSAYVCFPNVPVVSGDVSISVWVRPDADNRLMRLLGRFQVADDNRDFCLFLGKENRLWVFLSDNGTIEDGHALLRASAQTAAPAGAWTHLAVSWDATRGADGLTLYANGATLATADAQTAEIGAIHQGTAELSLGAYDQTAGVVMNTFQGGMRGLEIFEGALSAAEIAAVYGMERSGVPVASSPTTNVAQNGKANASADKPILVVSSGAAVPPAPGTNQVSGTNAPVKVPYAAAGFRTVYVNANAGSDVYNGLAAKGTTTNGPATAPAKTNSISGVVNNGISTNAYTGIGQPIPGADGPKRTITAALSASKAGDTIQVTPGVYASGPVHLNGRKVIASGRVVIQ